MFFHPFQTKRDLEHQNCRKNSFIEKNIFRLNKGQTAFKEKNEMSTFHIILHPFLQ